MISGVKGDVAIHIYGDSMERMMDVGEKMTSVLAAIPGAVDIKMIPRTGLPSVNIEIDRAPWRAMESTRLTSSTRSKRSAATLSARWWRARRAIRYRCVLRRPPGVASISCMTSRWHRPRVRLSLWHSLRA